MYSQRTQRLMALALLSGIGLVAGCDDPSGPSLPTMPDSGMTNAITFLSPISGTELTEADDSDGDPSNGLQIKVSLNVDVVGDGTLQLNVADAMPQVVEAESGLVEFDATIPFTQNGNYNITAILTPSEGDPVQASTQVQIRSFTCALTVLPQPSGVGCDLGASADEDPVAPGLQTTLTAETNCSEVSVTINNLPSQTVEATDGTATIQVTLRDGQNTVVVSASDGLSDPTTVGPYPLSVRTTGPQFELPGLNANRLNTRLISDANADGARFYWAFEGNVTGVAPGATVALAFEPGLDGAPETVRVDDNGRFSFELSVERGEFYAGEMTLTATDICNETSASDGYNVRLDAVVPSVQIAEPVDGSLLVFSLDTDPTRAGAQVPVSLILDDPRPEDVDYEITVECASVSGTPVFVDRARGPGDRVTRAALLDEDPTNDAVIVSFQQSEQGEYICRAVIEGSSNPIVPRELVWRAFFERPSFGLFSPTQAPTCVRTDAVDIAGVGQDLDGNQPSLQATLSTEGAEDIVIPLEPRGGERYGVILNTLTLPDGDYDVSVSGQVLGQVDVTVEPEVYPIVVDRVGPTLSIVTPAADGVFEDADPATAGTQSAMTFEVCGAGGQTLNVQTFPPVTGSPFAIPVPAGEDCSTISLPAVTVPLGDVQIDVSVRDRCNLDVSASRVAAIAPDAQEARILEPVAGFINVESDDDANRDGCQFELSAIGQGLAEGAEFFVCTDVGQTAPIAQCNGRSSGLAGACRITGSSANGAQVACPVSLVDGVHNVTFVGVFGERIESAPIELNVDCSSPSVASLTLVNDENQDGCINAMERQNSGAPGTNARFRVQVQTVGMEDGQTVRLLTEDGTSRGSVALVDNQGVVTIELGEGQRSLTVSGRDAAGNALPGDGDDLVSLGVQIDTTPPTPALTNLVQAACLNAASDVDAGVDGLQYGFQITTGREPGDLVTANLLIDGALAAQEQVQVDALEFATQNLAEGAHNVAVTVTDACANVGSVSGFSEVNGMPDWNQPLSVAVVVDTVAPNLAITGLNDGTILEANDDADGNSGNGFQVDVVAELDQAAPLEEGQTLDFMINGAPAETTPRTVVAPAAGQTLVPARITISPGQQSIEVSAVDACGNAGASEAVDVDLQIPGCTSSITGFDGNPSILGAGDGIRSGNELTIDINGQVDLLDNACIGAPVSLLVDGVESAQGVVPAGGVVSFPQVTFVEGIRNVRLRVGPVDGNTLDSANQALAIDLSSPVLSVVQPLDGASVLTDSNAAIPGQQALIQVSVTEATVVTERTATLRVDGGQIGAPVVLDGSSPTQASFADVSLDPGTRTLQLCVSDDAGNTACADWSVNADPAAPDAVADLSAQINDARSTDVELTFTAPGDDGAAGGPVQQFAIRRADTPIDNETAWQNASASELIVAATVAPGGQEVVSLVGVGPGPNLAAGLQQNVQHELAVRAMDDAGRMGAIAQVTVDLRLNQTVVDVAPILGNYDDSAFFNQGSHILNAGDLDRDGFPDMLVVGSQAAASSATVVFGNDFATQPLTIPGSIFQGFFGLGGANVGDVNGDGTDDLAVIGVRNAFAGSAIALYFGCPAACNRADIATPDALITANDGRLLSVVAPAGNFNQRDGDGASIDDIFLGGSISAPATPTTAFVVSGRADWPALPASIVVADDPAATSDGVIVLNVPDGKAGYAGTGVGDISGDGRDDIVFSAGNPSVIYRFNGGVNLPDSITYAPGNADTGVVAHVCSANPDGYGEHIIGGIDLDGDPAGLSNFAVSDGINRRIVVFDENEQSIDCFGRSRSLFGNVFDYAGDIDGDGFQDLVVSHSDIDADAFVFYNDGLGRFGDGDGAADRSAHIVLDLPNLPKISVAGLGDVNGDGLDDFGALVKQPGAGNLQLIIYQ
ncbi:MAG: FG-GAP repeat domain-containing protein [Bradymonadia bacterium]